MAIKVQQSKHADYAWEVYASKKHFGKLIKKGFKNVNQLHGGILNYLEKIPEKNSLWDGECFVFDNRVSVKNELIFN